jgi:phospholipase C
MKLAGEFRRQKGAAMHADILNRIDHIVVLMMENRSFDNMLGWLYDPLNLPPFDQVPRDQKFDGVSGRPLFNPIPETASGSEYGIVPVGRAATLDTPPVNPGETYPHVNTQLFGTIIPPGNRPPYQPPYNLPDPLPDQYPMNGFIILKSSPSISNRPATATTNRSWTVSPPTWRR